MMNKDFEELLQIFWLNDFLNGIRQEQNEAVLRENIYSKAELSKLASARSIDVKWRLISFNSVFVSLSNAHTTLLFMVINDSEKIRKRKIKKKLSMYQQAAVFCEFSGNLFFSATSSECNHIVHKEHEKPSTTNERRKILHFISPYH